MKYLIIIFLSLFLVGCIKYVDLTPEMRSVEYNYQVDGKNKKQIWKRARNYFATFYGDSRSVFSVQDEEEGTMIGKGTIKWVFEWAGAIPCYHDYHIRFDAENGNGKLKLEIMGMGSCKLTEKGYEQIKFDLKMLNLGLRNALLK
tara:strand:+ start:2336 stop:2770 length:435 start_codon:yes stop_codon:yes gene_type:complete